MTQKYLKISIVVLSKLQRLIMFKKKNVNVYLVAARLFVSEACRLLYNTRSFAHGNKRRLFFQGRSLILIREVLKIHGLQRHRAFQLHAEWDILFRVLYLTIHIYMMFFFILFF